MKRCMCPGREQTCTCPTIEVLELVPYGDFTDDSTLIKVKTSLIQPVKERNKKTIYSCFFAIYQPDIHSINQGVGKCLKCDLQERTTRETSNSIDSTEQSLLASVCQFFTLSPKSNDILQAVQWSSPIIKFCRLYYFLGILPCEICVTLQHFHMCNDGGFRSCADRGPMQS